MAAWHPRSWRLPDVGPVGIQALATGCGIAGDDTAAMIVLWHGSTVAWLAAPENAADVSLADEVGSFTYEGDVSVLAARPVAQAQGIAVVISGGKLSILRCQADGQAQEAALLSDLAAVDAWPLGAVGAVLLCEGAHLQHVDLGQGPTPAARTLAAVGEEPSSLGGVSATALRCCPQSKRGEDMQSDALAVAAGWLAGRCVLRVWHLRSAQAEGFAELALPGVETDGALGTEAGSSAAKPQAGATVTEAAPQDVVVALAVSPAAGSLCALQADGTVVVAARKEGPAFAWDLCARLTPHRVAGLRLCAVAGLDEDLLEEEDKAPPGIAPASRACALHVWDDDAVALIFPGFAGISPKGVPEIVTLAPLEAPVVVARAPYRPLCAVDATALCLVGCGSAGGRLVFAARGEDGGHRLGILERTERPATRAVGAAPRNVAVVQRFRELAGIQDLPEFAEACLKFDPFSGGPAAAAPGGAAFGCEQLRRLLEAARLRLRDTLGCGAGASSNHQGAEKPEGSVSKTDGWDDTWDVDFDDLVGEGPAAAAPQVASKKPEQQQDAGDGWDDDGWDVDLDALPAGEAGPAEDEALAAAAAAVAPATGSGPAASARAAGDAVPEDFAKLQALLARVDLQLSRLEVFGRVHSEAAEPHVPTTSLRWADFRETDAASLRDFACRMAAEQCVPALEALFAQQRDVLVPHWAAVLDSLPETAPVRLVQRVLPAPLGAKADTLLRVEDGGVAWYVRRAQRIVDCTGLCGVALDLLRHAIHVNVVGRFPPETPCSAEELPDVAGAALAARPAVRQLYGMFRLCAEYSKYSTSVLEELYLSSLEKAGSRPDAVDVARDAVTRAEMMDVASFCELPPGMRAQLALRRSTAATVAGDVREWARRVSVAHCSVGRAVAAPPEEAGGVLGLMAEAACDAPVEDAIMEALLGRLNSSGWDPAVFQLVAEVVTASSPELPQEERIIRSPLTMLEFILGAVYSDDQRCHALDIFESVDAMYSKIPKADATVPIGSSAERYAELQRQADELEKHLGCLDVLRENKIGLSLSFADLRRGCTNEPMAVRSLWNLFRVLGARYRPALFWRSFQQKLSYLHSHAFAAVSVTSVSEMLVRCLVEQEHFDVMSDVTAEWAARCNASEVAGSLVALAQELVNSSPALRHASLEKARRVLRCVPQVDGELSGLVRAELDFIKACELLHDLIRHRPRHKWAEEITKVKEITKVNPIASLSQVKSAVSAQVASLPSQMVLPSAGGGAATATGTAAGQAGAETFRVDSPVQLRLQMHQPVRVVTDLLQHNPPVLLETEELHTFCKLLGLVPSSPDWAEVMALCGAANLLCGQRSEALEVTEKLLTNAHPAAWKLALALTSIEGSGILGSGRGSAGGGGAAAGAGTCGGGPGRLGLDCGSDLLADAAKVCPAEELPQLLGFFEQGPPAPPGRRGQAAAPPPAEARRGTAVVQARGYAADDRQASSLCLLAQRDLGLGEVPALPRGAASAGWRGLELWEGTGAEDWEDAIARQRWGEALLAVDASTGVALLDAAGGWAPADLGPAGAPAAEPAKAPAKAPAARAPRRPRQAKEAAEAPAGGTVPAAAAVASPAPDGPPAEAPQRPEDVSRPPGHGPGVVRPAAPPPSAMAAPVAASAPMARALPSSPRDLFPIDFDFDFGDDVAGPAAAAAQGTPELQGSEGPAEEAQLHAVAAAPLAALAEPAASAVPFAEQEREVYQTMLPSLHSAKAVRAAAARVLQALQERSDGAVEDSSARVLLCRRMLDMCEEVSRAHGLDECPENEPGGGTLTSALSSMHEACPVLDLTQQGPSLVEEVLRCVDGDAEAAPRLIQAVAGVEVLQEVGISPSAVALRAAKREAARGSGEGAAPLGLAALVLWLLPGDAVNLLVTTMDDGRISQNRKLEVLAHLREALAAKRPVAPREEMAGWTRLHEALRQADALTLLASVHRARYPDQAERLRLRVDADVSLEAARVQWLHELAVAEETAAFVPCAEAVLQDHGAMHGEPSGSASGL